MKFKKKSLHELWMLALFLFFVFATIAGCARSEDARADKPKVVATTNMIADVAAAVAGDKIQVVSILDFGQDPHGYTLTPKDLAAVEQSDVLFINGFDLEEHMLDSLENVAAKLIIEVSEGIVPIEHVGEDAQHDHNTDPHTWMSPLNVIVWVDNIVKGFEEIDPDNADFYRSRARSYQDRLEVLHSESINRFAAIASEQRVLITDHDVFAYFARDYGFRVAGNVVPSISTNADISARHVSQLISVIREQHVPAIFVSSTAGEQTEKMIQMIQNEIAQPIRVIRLLTGSLQAEGMPGHTYLDFVRFNVDQVLSGLSELN